MPFIPHTSQDITQMLSVLKIKELKQLFEEIPKPLSRNQPFDLAEGESENLVTRLMQEREPKVQPGSHFIGAGAYEHHIPAAVWQVASRGEFLTAYTPYQAEASQGTLQLVYEYQTMMARLLGMEISNASLYDGASALAEAVLMALRLKAGKAKRIWVPQTLHPAYRQVLKTILQPYKEFIEEIPFLNDEGYWNPQSLKNRATEDLAAIIIPQPNFFGVLEEVDALTNFAHQQGALVIGVVNPIAMALLKEPGKWGEKGADIVCGEGQPLGIPLASGGPYFGFLCCRKTFVRQLPGRIVGRTHDSQGRTGYTLTLQTREQHIRRAKATSNICTNQGLLVTAATIYMSLLGGRGLQNVAAVSHHHARLLQESLTAIPGVVSVFSRPIFHEFVIRLPMPVNEVLKQLARQGLEAGFSLVEDYPQLSDCLLVCATETKTQQDLLRYQQCLEQCLNNK